MLVIVCNAKVICIWTDVLRNYENLPVSSDDEMKQHVLLIKC